MTFSTRSNPRLAQSGVALTSLGAVGGARGVSAGGLRVLVEFITSYSSGALEKMEKDLRNLEQFQQVSHTREKQRVGKIMQAQQSLNEIKIIEKKLTRDQRTQLAEIYALEASRSKSNRTLAAQKRKDLERELSGTMATQNLSKSEIALLGRRHELEKRLTKLKQQQATAEHGRVERARKIAQIEEQIGRVQVGRATLGQKLAGLAIGAVGGIVGGAVLGVGFQIAEQAIAKLGDVLQDLVDPARHARESVKELAKAVDELAGAENITRLEAAQKIIEKFGVAPGTALGRQLSGLLEEVAVRERIIASLEQEGQLLDVLKYKKTLDLELRKAVSQRVIEEAKLAGTYRQEQLSYAEQISYYYARADAGGQQYIGTLTLEEAVTQRVAEMTRILNQELQNSAAAQAQAAQGAAFNAIQQENLAIALQAVAASQSAAIDQQIANLGSGVSARTKRLQNQINRASGGGGGAGSQLRDIAEERQLILLRKRLRLLGTAINLEKYSGKFLLEAINAKIAALQKEGAERQRINQLLDWQYRMGQEIKRGEGESIEDFLARRAQEQRALLEEKDEMDRERQIARLEARREEVQDEVALAELAERRKEALRAAGQAAYMKGLQERLKKSQEADKKALEAKKKALEEEKKKVEQTTAEIVKITSEGYYDQTMLGIQAADSFEKLNSLSGRIAGYRRARSALQALVEGFAIPRAIAQPFLAKIDALLAAYQHQRNEAYILAKHRGYATGGVFTLKNSNATFGQNVKLGEQGTELGVILSNKVVQALKANSPNTIGSQTFIINKSDDPLRDKYAFGKLVTESVEAALR